MRKFGDKNFKPRKDKGKSRKVYRGKPVKKKRMKNGNMVLYVSKRGRDDPLHVQFVQMFPMTLDGFHNFPKNLRSKIKRVVHKGTPTIYVNPSQLSTIENIEQLSIDALQCEGSWQLRMPTKRKNKGGVSMCKKAVVKITDTEEGLRANVSEYHNLSRYWFFKNG